MDRIELTKTFMMISIWEKPFGLHGLYKKIQRFIVELRMVAINYL